MPGKPATHQNRTAYDRWCRAQQMELFGSGPINCAIGAPAWPELPAETQATLTGLMARLILEHVDKSRTVTMTEAGHDL